MKKVCRTIQYFGPDKAQNQAAELSQRQVPDRCGGT